MILEIVVCTTLATGGFPTDRWFGEDKLRHFFVSFMVTSVSASGARAAGFDHRQSLTAGIGVGVAAGIWKEVRDHGRPGETASVRDLLWDFAGVAAAAAMVHQGRPGSSATERSSGSQIPDRATSSGYGRGFTGRDTGVY